jgi:fatty-acyl-CoA synthase
VVLREGKTPTLAELQDWLRPNFPKFWIPEAIVFAEAIPRTSAGKFKKSELRERYAAWTWPTTSSS